MSNLPKELLFFKSSDKSWHQEPDLADLANCCSPVFAIITGNTNCGKTSLVKNLLIHKNPHYERIVVYSPLGEATTEYSDDIPDVELIDFIPDFDFFDREVRSCFILEDADLKQGLNKEDKYKLGRYFGVFSSHNNIDIYVIVQNPYDMLPQIRRLANICFFFKNNDVEALSSLARKFNIKTQDFKHIMTYVLKEKWDSLCIDNTRPTEYRLRKNIYELIKL